MDDSISMEEGDSLFSPRGAPDSRVLYHTPPHRTVAHTHSVGLNLHTPSIPQRSAQLDDSFEQPNQWNGASPANEQTSFEYVEEDDEDEEQVNEISNVANGHRGVQEGDEEEEDEDGDVEYPESDGSSAQYDPDADPEAFAQRLDELAGVLEMGEEEARALRWGPSIGREQDAPVLPLAQFKNLINHHLTSTEWRYSAPNLLLPAIPGRRTASLLPGDMVLGTGDMHPIRVLGRGWVEADEDMYDESDQGGSSPLPAHREEGLFAGQ